VIYQYRYVKIYHMILTDTQILSLKEAEKIVKCSRITLIRHLNKNGSDLGATKLEKGKGWKIPITTLEALGLLPYNYNIKQQNKMTSDDIQELKHQLELKDKDIQYWKSIAEEKERTILLLENRKEKSGLFARFFK